MIFYLYYCERCGDYSLGTIWPGDDQDVLEYSIYKQGTGEQNQSSLLRTQLQKR